MTRCDYVDNTGKRCKTLTSKKPNPNNNMRLYCSFCQGIVDAINEKRKENCINEYKEKLINYIKKQQKFYNGTEIDLVLDILLQKIINGEFNNE